MTSFPVFGRLAAIVACLVAFFAAAQSELPPTFQPAPRPMPSSVQLEADLRLEVYFPALSQGGVGLLRLAGGGIQSARAAFHGRDFAFFPIAGDAWYALLAADMNLRPGDYELTALAERESGSVAFARPLRVERAGFIAQALDLPSARAYLASADIENDELALLAELTASASPTPLWDASGFELPHDSELTSPFGAFRLLDVEKPSRHTGWDQNLPIGAPVRAMAAGAVAFAGQLAIRGNYMLIDHGLGVYSGYAHFSELHASAGQRVEAGQIIGLSGNSGRSSAPHLHWEVAIGGTWVDGRVFLDLWLPSRAAAVNAANAP